MAHEPVASGFAQFSESDFDRLCWHDCHIWGIAFRVNEPSNCKIYPVFDLVVRSPDVPPVGPAVDFRPLIDGLTSTVAPETWDDVGGPGSVMAFANAGALVVLQKAAVHEEIDLYLRTLREIGAAH
ncbi:MAG TPA: hypothetical protein VFI31_06435 [Pirellulales bacterium]|nr:hypothetical protein [Pirellulales bacterium]